MQSTAQEICWELHDKLIPLQLEPGYWVTGLVLLFIFCFGPLTGEINESVKAEYTDQCTCSCSINIEFESVAVNKGRRKSVSSAA